MQFKTQLITASLLAVLGSSAFAAEAEPDSTWITSSVHSRAEVLAETLQARRNGQLSRREASFNITAAAPSLRRVQVVAETREALRLGLLQSNEAETPSATQSELAQIRRAGLSALIADSRIVGN